MLTAVTIENLRGIRTGTLDGLTPLVVLVGPNGAGKSTVLDALSLGVGASPEDAVAQAVLRRGRVFRGAAWLVRGGPGQAPAVVETTGASDDRRAWEIAYAGRVEAPPEFYRALERPIDALDIAPRGRRGSLHGRVLVGANGRALETGNERALALRPLVVDTAAAGGAPPLHDLYSATVTAGRRRDVLALVRTLLPTIEDLSILTDEGTPALHLVSAGGSVPAEAAGDGTAALLRIVFELATRPNGLGLLEEPESHQHPAAIRQIGRAVVAAAQRGVQVVISTHSLEVLDALLVALKDDQLPLLSVYQLRLDPDGTLRHARLAGPDVALARGDIDQDLR